MALYYISTSYKLFLIRRAIMENNLLTIILLSSTSVFAKVHLDSFLIFGKYRPMKCAEVKPQNEGWYLRGTAHLLFESKCDSLQLTCEYYASESEYSSIGTGKYTEISKSS
jgi:hypothetical protein